MQVVILAGGKGTRLRPLTYQTPKAMLTINGKPFLEYQLKLIRSYGFCDAIVLAGYLGEQIMEYFGDGQKLGMNLQYVVEVHPLGTGGALKNGEDKLEKEFLLMNGDTFLPIDYGKIVNYFHQCNTMAAITVYDNRELVVPNNIAIGELNRVVHYNKKDSEGMTHVDAGALVLKKDVLNLVPSGRVCSLEEEIFPKLIKMKQLSAFTVSHRFYDIGTFKDLELINSVLK